jgi:DNA-binding CsgD family transcriptional regulator
VLGVASLGALRALAASTTTVLAMDDVQWLDPPSGAVISFALRRLEDDSLAVLLARRSTESSTLELKPDEVELVQVEPLSIGALHRVIVDQFGAAYSRPVLRRLHETSGGNPFFALELARALERRGERLHSGDDFPVPSSLEELVSDRLDALSPAGRRTVAVAGLLARPTTSEVGLGPALDEALAAAILERDNDGLAFTHPLLAAAARASLTPEESRSLHAELADLVTDEAERVRHRALAADTPDERAAGAAERAAQAAAARGEHSTAAYLLQLALSVTPPDALESERRRSFQLAHELIALGERDEPLALLQRLASELPPGGDRSDALLELGLLRDDDLTCAVDLTREALAEADSDSRRAAAHAGLSGLTLQLGETAVAREHARRAVELGSEPGFAANAFAHELLLDTLAGAHVPEEVVQRALRLDKRLTSNLAYPVPLSVGLLRMYTDQHDDARGLLRSMLERLEERVESTLAPRLHLAELEVRAGRYEEADRQAAEALADAEQRADVTGTHAALYAAALVDAHRGRDEQARARAEQAVALAREAGDWIFECQAVAVLGFLELSLERPAEAVAILEPLARRLVDAGLGDPSVWVGALPSAVEALIAIGELERARPLLATLEAQGAALSGPWTRARAARAAGLLAAAEGRDDDAVAAFEAALGEAEIPFERGRTLLALGAVQRRMRQRRLARGTLEEAKRIFDELGAELWAEQTAGEIARIGGRAPAADGLTPSEQRIADLVAAGKTIKEVAAILVVTDRTVESTLTRIYRKLDVRSRTELARKLTGA